MCLDKKRVPSKSFLGEYFFSACISDRLDIYQYFMWYVSSEYLSSWLDAVNSKSLSVCICMPSRFSCVWLFVTPWTVACQASLSFIISSSLLTLMSIESVMPSNHRILCCPLLLLSSIFSSIRVKILSHVWLFETPWTVAYQAPLSTGLFRQEYWSGQEYLLQG